MGKIPIPFLIIRIEQTCLGVDPDHALVPLPCVPGCGRGGTLSFMEGDHRTGDYLRVPVDIDPILGTLGKIEVLGPSRLERSAWTLQLRAPYHLPYLPKFGGEFFQTVTECYGMIVIHLYPDGDGGVAADRGADLTVGTLKDGDDRLEKAQVVLEIMIIDDDVTIIPHEFREGPTDTLDIGVMPPPHAVRDGGLDDPCDRSVVVRLEVPTQHLGRGLLVHLACHYRTVPNALSYCSIKNLASLSLASPMTWYVEPV